MSTIDYSHVSFVVLIYININYPLFNLLKYNKNFIQS